VSQEEAADTKPGIINKKIIKERKK